MSDQELDLPGLNLPRKRFVLLEKRVRLLISQSDLDGWVQSSLAVK